MYSNIMEIKFPNKSDNERFARTVAAAFVLELDPTVDQIAEIKTAVSEAVTNAIIHGYDEKDGIVTMSGSIEDDTVTFSVSDDGVGIPDISRAREPVSYTHLMSGVSHMLPFVIGGGILIAIAFLLDDFTIDPSNFGMNTPIAAFFKTIGGVAFGLMLPVLAGFIAYSIADRPGLAVGFVGGMPVSYTHLDVYKRQR